MLNLSNNVFAFDLEGTLSDRSGRITGPEIIKILTWLENSKKEILLCSGRDIEYLVAWKKRHGLRPETAMVAENGCVIVYHGKTVPTFEPRKFKRRKIIELLIAGGILELGEFDPRKQFAVTIYPRGFSKGKNYSSHKIFEIYERTKQILNGIECTIMFTSASAEVTPPDVNKATGLQRFCELSHTNPGDLIYFCDGNNDLPAAKFIKSHGGLVAVPANAVPELKKIADFVSRKRYDNGTAEILNRIISNG